MTLIFWLSSRSTLVAIEDDSAEKLVYSSAHLLTYAILAWLWWRTLSPQRQIDETRLWLALGLTILYGVSDEIHQSFVPGRAAQLADLLFDAAGAGMMIWLIWRVELLRTFPDHILSGKDVENFPRNFRGRPN
jgi:VanZ family protein